MSRMNPTGMKAMPDTGPAAGGTELTVLHGPHGQGATEQAARSDHREGWEYFLARLGQLLAPAPSE